MDLRDDEKNTLGSARCGACGHLMGLHVEINDDYGDAFCCAVCYCGMPMIGPHPRRRPMIFRGMASVGINHGPS